MITLQGLARVGVRVAESNIKFNLVCKSQPKSLIHILRLVLRYYVRLSSQKNVLNKKYAFNIWGLHWKFVVTPNYKSQLKIKFMEKAWLFPATKKVALTKSQTRQLV